MTWARLSLVGARREWECDLWCAPAHTPVLICARLESQPKTSNAQLWSTVPVDSESAAAGSSVSGEPHDEGLTIEAEVGPGPQLAMPEDDREGGGAPCGLLIRGLCQPFYELPSPASPEPL